MKANDFFNQYTGAETYYQHFAGFVYTDGVQAMCEKFECYWLLDVIVSYQPKLKDDFQVWTLKTHGCSGVVTCTDGNDNIYVRQEIPFTDFKPDEAVIWVEGNVLLLPTEH